MRASLQRASVVQQGLSLNGEQLDTPGQLQAFLNVTAVVAFALAADGRYAFIARTVRRFRDGRLKRARRLWCHASRERVSGYSRQ